MDEQPLQTAEEFIDYMKTKTGGDTVKKFGMYEKKEEKNDHPSVRANTRSGRTCWNWGADCNKYKA
ncbi:hypothetical protein GCM10020331_045300 [Ectobacillus funiculus]